MNTINEPPDSGKRDAEEIATSKDCVLTLNKQEHPEELKIKLSEHSNATTKEKLVLSIKEEEEFYEISSKIALKAERLLSTAQLRELTNKKVYLELNAIEESNAPEYYTVGVLCGCSNVQMSKSHISFVKMTFTNLKKSTTKPSTQTKNGYKTVAVFLYGSAAKDLASSNIGAVFAIVKPSAMPKNPKYEFALKVTQKEQLAEIGRALDFDYCRYVNNYTQARCNNFVNIALEHYCEMHAYKKACEIKATRPALQSTYININEVKKSKAEANSMFMRRSLLKKQVPQLSKKVKEKLDKWQANEADKLSAFMKKRREGKDDVNDLHELIKRTGQRKTVGKEEILELQVEDTGKDDNFIKKLMAKKTHSEKFNAGDNNTEKTVKRTQMDSNN